MILLIIFLPLFSSFCTGLFGSFLGHIGSSCLSIFCIFLLVIISYIYFYFIIILQNIYYIKIINWVLSDILFFNWGIFLDSLTSVMLCVITSISLCVHVYSINYMENDPHLSRFLSYLSLFTFFMILLVSADNFIQMFVGWEGVGFCSFLLINFWYTRIQANKASIKAMIVNRISDVFLIIGLFLIFLSCYSIEYSVVFSIYPFICNNTVFFFFFPICYKNIICIFLLVGAMGKSAQIFLHTWLPDAMEGPTPVSALIHAATMVTAGIFLITRCSFLFEYSPIILNLIIIIGSLTAFFAGTVGLLQNDLKRIIAYSTCSQLGYMLFSCGLSFYSLSIFHLSNHAFFKALLFLSAGSVIHALNDEQDIRKMGGLRRLLPFTYIMFTVGSLALMGFPFLSGFYSKDLILESAFASYTTISHFAFWLGVFGAFCTSFYSIRLLCLVFLVKTNSFKSIIIQVQESNSLFLLFPLFFLSVFSVFVGFLSKDVFVGFGNIFWLNSIFVTSLNSSKYFDIEFLQINIKQIPLLFSLMGFFISYYIYIINFKFFYLKKIQYLYVFKFLNKKWFFDKIYNLFINQVILKIAYTFIYKQLDKGFFEIIGPSGFVQNFRFINLIFNLKIQTGFLYNYCLLIFYGIFLILFYNLSLIG